MGNSQNKKRLRPKFYFCSPKTKNEEQPKGKLNNRTRKSMGYKAEYQFYSFLFFRLEIVNLFNRVYDGHSINKEDMICK